MDSVRSVQGGFLEIVLSNGWQGLVAALFVTATDALHPQQCKAAQLLLSSLYPTEFSSVRHTVVHGTGKQDALDLSKLPTDELRQLRKTLLKVQASANDGTPRALPAAASVIEVLSGNGARSV